MKVLWVVNTIFPELAKELGQIPNPSGGWMYGLADELCLNGGINLYIATVYSGKKLLHKKIDNINYYLIPANDKKIWGFVYDEVKPNITHIHGSEFHYGLDLMYQRPDGKYILSIQGLIGECAKNYLAGLTTWDVIKNISIRDIIKNDNLLQAKRKFLKKAVVEQKYFSKVNAVIGRTEWDKAHSYNLNPNIQYFHCDEMLRPEFYCKDRWSLDNCEKYSIFMSGGGYPLKGLHQVLRALYLIKKDFNTVKLYVSGYNFLGDKSLKSQLRISGYGLYIKRLIKKLNLEENVVFTGPLSAQEMKVRYLKSHVFICASSIENSPNSICEAQILGVPVIASYVGGIPTLIRNNVSGLLYDFNDEVMLKYQIKKYFDSYGNYENEKYHGNDINKILNVIINIYKQEQKNLDV